jgi:dihydrofolate reductase
VSKALAASASIRDHLGDCLVKAQRKVIVYIARPDGDVEWLNRRPRTVDYGMGAFYPTIDTILWGRRTYDWALAYNKKRGRKSGMFDTKPANYVFSRKPRNGQHQARNSCPSR